MIARNNDTLWKLLISICVVQGLYAIVGYLRGVRLIVAILTCVLEWGCYFGLAYAARVTLSNSGEILRPGNDLRSGWFPYLFDTIYITCFAQLGSLISAWFHLVFLAIPIYGGWAAISFLSSLSQMHQQFNPQQQQTPTNPKDRRKYSRART